jgi:hypothetical protein
MLWKMEWWSIHLRTIISIPCPLCREDTTGPRNVMESQIVQCPSLCAHYTITIHGKFIRSNYVASWSPMYIRTYRLSIPLWSTDCSISMFKDNLWSSILTRQNMNDVIQAKYERTMMLTKRRVYCVCFWRRFNPSFHWRKHIYSLHWPSYN